MLNTNKINPILSEHPKPQQVLGLRVFPKKGLDAYNMNIERFHNEIAMRLGYERIVKDKRISIRIVESDNPWVILKVQGHEDIRLNASETAYEVEMIENQALQNEIKIFFDAVHQAYIQATKYFLHTNDISFGCIANLYFNRSI